MPAAFEHVLAHNEVLGSSVRRTERRSFDELITVAATTILGANGRPTPKIGASTYGLVKGISNIDGD